MEANGGLMMRFYSSGNEGEEVNYLNDYMGSTMAEYVRLEVLA
tara:strand:+ start:329 stop:457 length:129 start_codon:yes stop_codon:yes gene_type:complete